MEKKEGDVGAHILVVPYPSQGHINPMLHLSKRLASKGARVTLATTRFIITTTMLPNQSHPPDHPVRFEIISDGCDEGGFSQAGDVGQYLERLESVGSKTLTELIKKYENSNDSVDCVIYDAFLPWVLDVVEGLGIVGAAFFTQACVVNYVYFCLHHGVLKMPVTPPVALPGLPELFQLEDMPSFVYVSGSYPSYFNMVLSQFSNLHKADCVLVNTFYELEKQVVDTMSKVCPSLLTIGPTIPSVYLDNRVDNDTDYGLDLFPRDPLSHSCSLWLATKPKASVIYVSFGSMACLCPEQMEEIACALQASNSYFLWVVRASEDPKIPKGFREATASKGLLVNWCPQMEVLASEAIGCFFTHCGWNSTVEALSLGVPMVGMPQWTDQPTVAKFVQDVWKVGVRVRVDESGIVRREEIGRCIREVMEGVTSMEMKENAEKWKVLAKQAISEGGSSDRNIDKLLAKLIV